MSCRFLIGFLIYLSSIINVFSQALPIDFQLAKNYYLQGDYEKAVLYYKKLSEDPSELKNIYQYYKSSLIELKYYKEAEKLCKSLIKQYPDNLTLIVDHAILHGQQGKEVKQNQLFEKAVNSLNSKTSFKNISELGLAFEKIKDLSRALLVYKSGEKFNQNNPYAFHDKIAFIYNKQGKTLEMINTYLELLDQSEMFLSSVQSGLSNSIDFDFQVKEKELLRKTLLKKVQNNPKDIVYVQLLAWYFLLNHDYENAFVQIKSIDKKLNKDGEELLSLANKALNNNNYNLAIKCFDEVIDNTQSNEKVFQAKNLRLRAIKNKLTSGFNTSLIELNELKDNYLLTLEQLNKSSNNTNFNKRKYELLFDLAILEAYYLNEITSAKEHLKIASSIRGLKEKDLAKLKLQLADFLMLENNIWEASLKYMQIEKQFKNDPLGHKAKFKNAQVYYYAGEFDWCQAQLEVLKASTSKLIANDALELSVLITDNYNMDTSVTAMELFAKADMLCSQYKYKPALDIYDSIINNFDNHSLNDEIFIRKANIFIRLIKYDLAISALKTIENDYSSSLLIDKALFLLAETYELKLSNIDLAKIYYKKILFEYPGSIYLIEARNRYRKLSGNTNQNIIKDS